MIKSFAQWRKSTKWKSNQLNGRWHLQMTVRGWYPKHRKNLHNTVSTTTKFWNKQRTWIGLFSGDDIQMAKRYIKRYSTSLIIRQTTKRCQLTPVRMAITKRQEITSVGMDVKKRQLMKCCWNITQPLKRWNLTMHTNTDDLEGINYIKGNKSKKDTVWFYLYAESEKQHEYTKQNRNIFIDTKHKLEF